VSACVHRNIASYYLCRVLFARAPVLGLCFYVSVKVLCKRSGYTENRASYICMSVLVSHVFFNLSRLTVPFLGTSERGFFREGAPHALG